MTAGEERLSGLPATGEAGPGLTRSRRLHSSRGRRAGRGLRASVRQQEARSLILRAATVGPGPAASARGAQCPRSGRRARQPEVEPTDPPGTEGPTCGGQPDPWVSGPETREAGLRPEPARRRRGQEAGVGGSGGALSARRSRPSGLESRVRAECHLLARGRPARAQSLIPSAFGPPRH